MSAIRRRALDIRRILDARFGLSIYGQAMRGSQRLEAVSDGALDAELAAIPRLAAVQVQRERAG